MPHYQPGSYDCIIFAQGFDESPEKKTPCFWLRFRPAKYDGEDIDGEYDREVRLWLTDKTVDRVVEQLNGLGWGGSSFRDLEPGGYSFEGVNVVLRCEHDQNGDKVYENWQFPVPGVKSEHKSGMGKKLDALFGKALKKGKTASKKKTETKTETVPAEDDDDIPF